MSRSSVAIIIPTYNRAELVVQAVESVLAQTRVPDEIIVVDDGSTDDTALRLAPFPSVKLIRQPNRGRSAARNAGLAQCTADFISFLDSDDILPPESIARRAAWLEARPACGLVYGDVQSVDLQGRTVSGRVAEPSSLGREPFAVLAKYNVLSISSYMLRREHLPKVPYFDETLEITEDWKFLLRVCAGVVRFEKVEAPVAYYRHHSAMTLAADSPLHPQTLAVQNDIYRMQAFSELEENKQLRILWSHALSRLKWGYRREGRECARRALKVQPSSVVSLGLVVLSCFPTRIVEYVAGVRSFSAR